ncbi:uncharacterized protein V1510DRAFT_412910 [Dipodascopsis tothii]|uniref:uncharacterized protein n=1 Tax=Dipodascopsis tothii TaxID=44089 RepID=UPI0034CEA8D4
MAGRRLLVCGGSGFLGKKLCETAVAHGWAVTSVSRSGEPRWPAAAPTWASAVKYASVDVLASDAEERLAPLLAETDAVAHTLGILLELDYYKTFASAATPVEGLRQVCAKWNRNPLKHVIEDAPTYESMNRDSAIRVAAVAQKFTNVKSFLYVSAASGFPGLPQAYIKTKREAEAAISAMPGLRPILLRPGFMFDPSRPLSMVARLPMHALSAVNAQLGGNVPVLRSPAVDAISTAVVAAAGVRALEDEAIAGPLDAATMRRLAREASEAA